MWRNDVTEVTVATAGKATSNIASTISDRIAMTAVLVITGATPKLILCLQNFLFLQKTKIFYWILSQIR